MSRLAVRLAERIRREGPLSVADYMAAALTDPDDGYYTRRDPLGTAGDFVTAPEISQMFGELIGAWCVGCWHGMGRPDPFALAELGPGRGTLMADILRVSALDPGFLSAARIHLVEASPVLQQSQRTALRDVPATWHRTCDGLPALPLLAVANEFLDALPVRQFEMTADGWRERLVDIVPDMADAGSPRFRFVLSAPLSPGALPVPDDAPAGTLAETCPQGRDLVSSLAGHIVAHGGATLIVDYGYDHGSGDTLQAVRAHRFANFLADPGSADLTAHVDFAALAAAATAAGARLHGVVGQGRFLRNLGIEARATVLKAGATAAQGRDIDAALRRLIADEEMGTLFKVMAIAAPALPEPAGFAR